MLAYRLLHPWPPLNRTWFVQGRQLRVGRPDVSTMPCCDGKHNHYLHHRELKYCSPTNLPAESSIFAMHWHAAGFGSVDSARTTMFGTASDTNIRYGTPCFTNTTVCTMGFMGDQNVAELQLKQNMSHCRCQ